MSGHYDTIGNAALTAAMLAVRHTSARRFAEATRQPTKHQKRLLKNILAANTDTVFGREHGFGAICGIDSYRARVPVHSYLDLKPLIDRHLRTGEACLTRESPVMYNRTSGTTGEAKLLPVTPAGLSGLRQNQRLFAQAQFHGSSFYRGRILAVVSPAVEGKTPNGTPFGSATGLIYATMPRFVRSKYIVRPALFGVGDYETKYYLIAALGLRERQLTGLVTANPSTFRKLLEIIRDRWDELLEDIASGQSAATEQLSLDQKAAFAEHFAADPERARELASLRMRKGSISFADIWPHLGGVITWTGGSCGFALGSLTEQWPETARIMEAGYISSEFWGSVNLDVTHGMCVPTITSTFMEFVERTAWENGGRDFLTLSEIEEGKQYYIFVTTPNGLYRYDMNDIVSVTGRFHETPTIAFVQKGRGVTNITGEKLYENQVTQAVSTVQRHHRVSIPFFVVLADEQSQQYRAYLETDTAGECEISLLGPALDRQLAELNIEYREKRASGRLRPLCAIPIEPGTGELYRRECVARGQSDAQFKALQLQYKRNCGFDFAGRRLAGA